MKTGKLFGFNFTKQYVFLNTNYNKTHAVQINILNDTPPNILIYILKLLQETFYFLLILAAPVVKMKYKHRCLLSG